MLLKQLDIQGFKSFPDKTKVEFSKGLTAVVGPNGSGKSNISDAVRWVMGEQSTKTLRGSKMEDVIFSGTKTRKSQGFAEVSLTIDNKEHEFLVDAEEIVITRRYDRSGDSEYLLNNSPVRLKDIHELLMDTGLGKDGYSLVGQGKIAEIVQSKSTERREIFEEAAGISKFRYRKNEAERNLTHAEENLVRLKDIMTELELRLDPLKEQSEKAQKFIQLSEQKKNLEISIWMDKIDKSNLLIKDQNDNIMIFQNQKEDLDLSIQETEENIQKLFSNMQNCLIEIDSIRAKKEETEKLISDKKSLIAVTRNDILHNNENINRLKSELEKHAYNCEVAESEVESIKNQTASKTLEIQRIDSEINSLKDELLKTTSESDEYTLREKQLNDDLNKLFLEQSQNKIIISSAKTAIAELNLELEKSSIMLKTKQDDIAKYEEEYTSVKQFYNDLIEKSESLTNAYNGHKLKFDNRNNKLIEIKSECEKISLNLKEKEQKVKLLENLEENLEGFAYSVKEVLKRAKRGNISGICGTVSQIIDVKDEYSTAIETALTSSMQNIVCESESSAKSAIRMLKEENIGRATFLPITSIKPYYIENQGFERYSGYIDIASNLVSSDAKYNGIIGSLLGRTIIVDDIDTAVLMSQKYSYKFKIVTLDGQVVNAGGSLTGGSKNKTQSFLSRKNEITNLKEEIVVISEKYAKNTANMNSILKEVSLIDAEIKGVKAEIDTINEDKIRAESELKRLTSFIEQNKISFEQAKNDIDAKNKKLQNLEITSKETEKTINDFESQIQSLNQELSLLRENAQAFVEIKSKLADELSSLNITKIELSKDIETLNSKIEEINKRQLSFEDITSRYNDDIQMLIQKENDHNNNIISLENDIKESTLLIEKFNETISETMKKRTEFEAQANSLRKDEKDISDKKEKITLSLVRLEEKKLQLQKEYDDIIAKLWDEYELTKSEALGFATKLNDVSKSSIELSSIKTKIKSLGSINVEAIEEYKEVSQRYEFMSKQLNDVEKSRSELLKLIVELTQKMQSIFYDNFVKINDNFKKIFVELFGGGQAELKLTDPNNLLESGIEIFVEPPGKIIKNLSSLSGGEQSFVAIAIYFAILKVRPAPFCILDEIEAALDDVNVDKYAAYLQKLSDKTQFITITHRRGTMEAADVLYGVTMQDEGVSKLLKLNVTEVENNFSESNAVNDIIFSKK